MTYLLEGKRYYWYINSYETKVKNGLFTGKYDAHNHNAILQTKNGEIWSIAVKDLYESNPLNLRRKHE